MSGRPAALTFALLLALLPALSLAGQSGRVERIVALSPHLTEFLYEIGAGGRLVGVVSHSDYPQQAESIERIGDYHRLDLERIVALAPDLIVSWPEGNPPRQLDRLRGLGIELLPLESRRLDDVAENLLQLGRRLQGYSGRAEQLALRYRRRLGELQARYRGRSPLRVFYQVWERPLMTIGRDHLISEAVRLCGGVTLFDDLGGAAPVVDWEAVVAADPQLVIGSGRGEESPDWVAAWMRWPAVSAVAAGAIRWVDPDLVQRPTPRLLDGVEAICRQMDEARRALASRAIGAGGK